MPNEFQPVNNKQPVRPKVYLGQYLINSDEPMDDVSSDSPTGNDAEILEINRHAIKRRFRDIALKMRSLYS